MLPSCGFFIRKDALLLFCFLCLSTCVNAFLAPNQPREITTRHHMSGSNHDSNNKAKNKKMLQFMDKPVSNNVGDNPRPEAVPIQDDPSADLVRCIVKAADGRKAENIIALRVSPVSTLTSFLVILSGNSRPQNQAIAASIRNDVEEEYDQRPMGNGVPEGSAESGWMLLDYGDVIVHVMTPKSRLYYNVEGQWREKGGVEMDLSDIVIPNTVEAASIGGTMDIAEEEDDPFWS